MSAVQPDQQVIDFLEYPLRLVLAIVVVLLVTACFMLGTLAKARSHPPPLFWILAAGLLWWHAAG